MLRLELGLYCAWSGKSTTEYLNRFKDHYERSHILEYVTALPLLPGGRGEEILVEAHGVPTHEEDLTRHRLKQACTEL